jgi:hypothetical protein
MLRVVAFPESRTSAGLGYHEAGELENRLTWPDGWPPPAVDDVLELPGESVGRVHVRAVDWYPMGEGPDDPEPFVYVVVGMRHPDWTRTA